MPSTIWYSLVISNKITDFVFKMKYLVSVNVNDCNKKIKIISRSISFKIVCHQYVLFIIYEDYLVPKFNAKLFTLMRTKVNELMC